MPPKKKPKDVKSGKKALETKTAGTCRSITPGPQYQLKTLVGYKDHCLSKYRNPAFKFGGRHVIFSTAEGPGPIYMLEERRVKGFTFGHIVKRRDIEVGPGPKYTLPDIRPGPFFTIKWRTKPRKISETPGPYFIKPISDAPAFSIGQRRAVPRSLTGAGPYSYNLDAVKPRAPIYTIAGARRALHFISASPGPIYDIPPHKPTPAFSFGVKHSECESPYITKCDEEC